jgi:hypothetical protein
MLRNKFPFTGSRIIWVPREVEGWECNDEQSNEFVPNLGHALDDDQMTAYLDWSERPQHGNVVEVKDETFTVELIEPFLGTMKRVTYPVDAYLGEYWDRVQDSPDFYQVAPLEEGDRFFVKVEEAPEGVEDENGGRVVLYFSVHGRDGGAAISKLLALRNYLRGGDRVKVIHCVESDNAPPMIMVTMVDVGQAVEGLADEKVIDADYVMLGENTPVGLKPPTDPRARLIEQAGIQALEVDGGAQHYVVHNGVLCSVNGSYFMPEVRRRCGPGEWCRWVVNPADYVRNGADSVTRDGADQVALAYFAENDVIIFDPRTAASQQALRKDPGAVERRSN